MAEVIESSHEDSESPDEDFPDEELLEAFHAAAAYTTYGT